MQHKGGHRRCAAAPLPPQPALKQARKVLFPNLLHRLYPAIAGLLALLPPCWPLAAQNVFQQAFERADYPYFLAEDLVTDSSGHAYVAGEAVGDTSGLLLLKVSPAGQPLWCKRLGFADPQRNFSSVFSIQQAPDKGLIINANLQINGSQDRNALLKTDTAGQLLWAVTTPCSWRDHSGCTDASGAYLAGPLRGMRRFLLSKVSHAGQPLWERQLSAGQMDFFFVESLVALGTGQVLLAIRFSEQITGMQVTPEKSAIFRYAADGAVERVAFFDKVLVSALAPLGDGRFAFRASASNLDWTGVGMMDADFNCLWFKTLRLKSGLILPTISGRELAVSRDKQHVQCVLYTAGGEKIALFFDGQGGLLSEQVFFSGPFAEKVAPIGTDGFLRASGLRSNAFMLTRTGPGAEPSCFFASTCGLELRDSTLLAGNISWLSQPSTCAEPLEVVAWPMPLGHAPYCFDPAPFNAAFLASDTLVCVGESIDFQRLAGAGELRYGSSDWFFEQGLPSSANGAVVDKVRFVQAGTFRARHIFNVAGCADTSWQTIRVLPAPASLLPDADTTLCTGDSLLLRASEGTGLRYRWSDGDTLAERRIGQAGLYAVTITQSAGCQTADSLRVSVLAPQTLDLGPDTTVCQGAALRIGPRDAAVLGSAVLRWSDGQGTPFIEVQGPGLFALRATIAACAFADTLRVDVEECPECAIFAPNVFAPEGGTANERFRIFADCPLMGGRLRIYDRWGNLLHQQEGGTLEWDGRADGTLLPPGLYLFSVEIELAGRRNTVEHRRVDGGVLLWR
jgi:gliding motility-associated-like protein